MTCGANDVSVTRERPGRRRPAGRARRRRGRETFGVGARHRHEPVDARRADRGGHGRRAPVRRAAPGAAAPRRRLLQPRGRRGAARRRPTRAKIAGVLAAPPPLSEGHATSTTPRRSPCASYATRKVSAGSVVVLSDGADVGSNLKPGRRGRRRAARRRRGSSPSGCGRAATTARRCATSRPPSGGRYAEADEHSWPQLFAALGRRFGREYLVTYRSLAPLSTHVQVQARVAGVSGAALVTYTSPPRSAPSPLRRRASRSAFIGSSASLAARGRARRAPDRPRGLPCRCARGAAPYDARIADFTADASSAHAAVAVDAFGDDPGISTRRRRGTPSRRWAAFAEDVDVAGLSRSPERIALLTVAGTARRRPRRDRARQPDPRGACSGRAGDRPRRRVGRRANARAASSSSQLADNLQVVASAMRAGQSFIGRARRGRRGCRRARAPRARTRGQRRAPRRAARRGARPRRAAHAQRGARVRRPRRDAPARDGRQAPPRSSTASPRRSASAPSSSAWSARSPRRDGSAASSSRRCPCA